MLDSCLSFDQDLMQSGMHKVCCNVLDQTTSCLLLSIVDILLLLLLHIETRGLPNKMDWQWTVNVIHLDGTAMPITRIHTRCTRAMRRRRTILVLMMMMLLTESYGGCCGLGGPIFSPLNCNGTGVSFQPWQAKYRVTARHSRCLSKVTYKLIGGPERGQHGKPHIIPYIWSCFGWTGCSTQCHTCLGQGQWSLDMDTSCHSDLRVG
jgi:hypothetical protein